MNKFIIFILTFIKYIEDEDMNKILLLLLQNDEDFNIFINLTEEGILILIEKIIPILNSLQITYNIYRKCKLDNNELFKEKNNHIIIQLYNVIFQNINRNTKLIDNDLENFQTEILELFNLIIYTKNIELINLFLNFELLIPLGDNSKTLLDILGKIYRDYDISNLNINIFDKYTITFYYQIKHIINNFTTTFPDWKTSDVYINWLKTQKA
jgi:hypothetical protein